MTEFKIGDRVRYLGTPYYGITKGAIGTIVSFADGASGARYAHVIIDGQRWDFDINGKSYSYTGPEIEKWFDEPDTTAQQDAIDRAYEDGYRAGYSDGYAQGVEDY